MKPWSTQDGYPGQQGRCGTQVIWVFNEMEVSLAAALNWHILCVSVLSTFPLCVCVAVHSTLFALMFLSSLHAFQKFHCCCTGAQTGQQCVPPMYTKDESHISVPFPNGAPELALFYQGCVDHWAGQGFHHTVTGRLVVDNLWQPLYEAHCLRNTCGCTVFERTNITEHCEDGLRCIGFMASVCCCCCYVVISLLLLVPLCMLNMPSP